jgi:hypothetical protein
MRISKCTDFVDEVCALQEVIESEGHLLIFSPKCHPELAGNGIEFAWGKMKFNFRNKINNRKPTDVLLVGRSAGVSSCGGPPKC